MVRGTLPMVWDGSEESPKGPGKVGRPSWRTRTGRGLSRRSGTGRRPYRMSGMGRGSLPEVWEFGGPTGRSGTGRETLGEVWDGSGDPPGGPGLVEYPMGGSRLVEGPSQRSGRVEGPSGRSGTGQETLEKVWDGLRDPRAGPKVTQPVLDFLDGPQPVPDLKEASLTRPGPPRVYSDPSQT